MFSWSSGPSKKGGSSQYPGRRLNRSGNAHVPIEGSIRPPSGEITRAQHLQSYLDDPTLQRSTRRVSSDDTTYDTVFQTTRGDTLILRVNVPLTSSFASFCPAMTLAGVRVRHSWVDHRMRITGFEPIQSESAWKSANVMLGKAVHAVVQHMQLNPPDILEITDKGLQAIQSKTNGRKSNHPAANGHRNANGTTNHHSDEPPSYNVFKQQTSISSAPDVPMPSIPKKFPELETMDRDGLEDLLQDELEFLSLVHKLEVYDKIQSVGTSKLEENVKLAEANLDKEADLKRLHNEVQSLQSSLKQKIIHFQSLEAKQNALCAPPDEKSTLRRLNRAKKEAFDESEAYAEDWVEDGAPDVDKFVNAFVEKRKTHHQRAAKMELLEQHRS